MTRLLVALGLVVSTVSVANASVWSELPEATRARLESDRTVSEVTTRAAYLRSVGRNEHANERGHEAIFRVTTVYKILLKEPAHAAGAFSNYNSFSSIFGRVGIRAVETLTGQLPVVNVLYRKATSFAGIDGRVSVYQLENRWEAHEHGGFVNKWVYVPGHAQDNGDSFHVEGEATFEPVTLSNGLTATLVKYVNYINPGEGDIPLINFRTILDSDAARQQNLNEVINMVNTLGRYVLNNDLTGRVTVICNAVSGERAGSGCP